MADKWSDRLLRTRAQVQALIAGSGLNYPGFYQISNAVGNTKQILVWSLSASTITNYAQDMTTGSMGIYDITADTFTDNPLHGTYTPVFTPQNNPNNTCDVLADSLVIQVDTDSVTFFVTVLITLDVADTQETFVFNLIPPPNSNFTNKFQIRGLASRADATIFTDVFYGVLQAVSGDVTAQFFVNTDTAGNSGTFVLSGRYHK